MWPFRRSDQRIFSALVDLESGTLLALSSNPSVIVFLSEGAPDTAAVHSANYRQPLPFSSGRTERYPEWAWKFSERCFMRSKAAVVTQTARARSRLAVQKARVIETMMANISIARYPVSMDILFQESVYLTKRIQAEAFKNAGYPDDDLTTYPYVTLYADLTNLTPRQAADEILFKAKLDDDTLAKTELLRIKYFNRVKETTDPEKLPDILSSFMRECYRVAIK